MRAWLAAALAMRPRLRQGAGDAARIGEGGLRIHLPGGHSCL